MALIILIALFNCLTILFIGMFNSLNQPKPQTGSFFSQPTAPVTSTTFGASPAFSFTNQTSQPASVFGANNTTVSTGGLGQTSTFTFGQPQAQTQSTGIFGQKPMTSAPSTAFGGGFGASAFTNTSTANKPTLGFSGFGTSTAPTFGTTTTNFGTGTSSGGMFGFQNQTQNKPFSFSTPFATQSQAQPTQPTFGKKSTLIKELEHIIILDELTEFIRTNFNDLFILHSL